MYEIKRLEAGQQQQQQHHQQQQQQPQQQLNTLSERLSGSVTAPQLTCSIITPPQLATSAKQQTQSPQSAYSNFRDPTEATHMTLLTLRRRRVFQRRACLLSILAAFVFGMALGVIVPMFGLPDYFGSGGESAAVHYADSRQPQPQAAVSLVQLQAAASAIGPHPPSDFPSIYSGEQAPYTVSFIKDTSAEELTAEQVFRNAFHLEQDKNAPDSMIVKKLDTNDGSIKEFHVQRTSNGRYRKGPERRLSKPTLLKQDQQRTKQPNIQPLRQPIAASSDSDSSSSSSSRLLEGIIKSDIYWGDLVERALPKGFAAQDQLRWEQYLAREGQVLRLEPGCGRMQNRMVVFADGSRACARYRQNTDQIQGEIFSYYLGRLLNISNLAPSAATVIDTTKGSWSAALGDITQAQWKEKRPVVLTRWLPDLEPAGIPQPFQPLERHLNKYDVWNMTLAAVPHSQSQSQSQLHMQHASEQQQRGLLKRLEAASNEAYAHQSRMLDLSYTSPISAWAAASAAIASSSASASASASELATSTSTASTMGSSALTALQQLIELAQWSDLIVFDYLIANLDRVVNNLYNFQWNADIMAAPAHNLARQSNSQLLVFLDNESGLLHGYRLLKKYEAYHSLLLDNLCVFRQPTIEALQRLRAEGAGQRLRQLFERTTSASVRDVLPSLPDKSIKILVERIDRVLAQVQKCRDLLADSSHSHSHSAKLR